MRRRLCALATLPALLLAGCGGGAEPAASGDSPSPTTAGTSSVGASPEASPGGPMTIDMVGWRHGTVTDGIASLTFGSQADTDELVTILQAADATFG